MKLDEKEIKRVTRRWRTRVYIEHPEFTHIVEPSIYMGEGAYTMDIGAPLKNYRHELFALAIVRGMSQTDAAIEAGYSRDRARFTGRDLATYSHIIERIGALHKAMETPAIMNVRERKAKLSEIARPVLTDFVVSGQDGAKIEVFKESPGRAAIQEVTTRTEVDKEGKNPAAITKLKLHDPVKAIAELNRMEGEHAPAEMRHTGADGGPVVLKVVYDEDEKDKKK